ncbi:mitochondrial ribosomal protein L21 precursor, putative [Plasmodium berghei]|uniref:Large ribosomal subunit protein bL21m n=3 Tax=Plasmodium berghei TaxID=5821 RepID=A0A509AKY0_PLABA|nr:mitochondrial ribosomal protein L21 precursor, putative [Plasmodium berghei ANKA]CXI53029.1 mitochondrial ribosomal protein L21 precursor, putative [Plasmodium berghei]SCM17884.1 mitochondrial ribosomal protein L21 precursor, putative [Plasmodium berghei]VUC56210.1 mitochondrial ribosomal protein L21 precursor, putative [Plasmodium berghei ANKA]|eukprot:XP_034422012.1 mitochondrial ribosomal protein L21 precursor, putative [Plasmodium berghei ANKA]
MLGKHRKRKINPPLYPIHPNEEKKKNLNNFITYKDLKIRWKNTSKNYRKKVTIARKWKNLHCLLPQNKSSCIFVLHKNLPITRNKRNIYNCNIEKDVDIDTVKRLVHESKESGLKNGLKNEGKNYNTNVVIRGRRRNKPNKLEYKIENPTKIDNLNNYYDKPPKDLEYLIKKSELFCIFKSNFINEHKVIIGDIVQTEKLHRKKAGDVVYFGTVLFIGSKDFSIIGKPTIPYCKVKATIEQVTLSKEILSFRYKKVRRSSRFLRVKHWVTILKIDDIIIDLKHEINDERKKPLQILDLWANRWLYQKELNFIKFDKNNKPLAEKIYDLIEHQPNTLHRRGLNNCYRFHPDPYLPLSY